MQSSSDFLTLFAEKEAKRFKLKVGVFLFLIQNNQILLLRRFQTGIEDGLYVVPMGGHDGRDPLTSSLIREVKEETNINLQKENLRLCHLMHRFHSMPQGLSFEQLDVFFRVDSYEGTIKNLEPQKCDELQFYPLEQLPNKISPFIRCAIENTLKGKIFSEFGWK